jgi:hypothetical protein
VTKHPQLVDPTAKNDGSQLCEQEITKEEKKTKRDVQTLVLV